MIAELGHDAAAAKIEGSFLGTYKDFAEFGREITAELWDLPPLLTRCLDYASVTREMVQDGSIVTYDTPGAVHVFYGDRSAASLKG